MQTFTDLFSSTSPLVSIIATTYVCEWKWFASLVPINIPIYVVISFDTKTNQSEEALPIQWGEGIRVISLHGKEFVVVHPPLQRGGIMHAKMILLEFETHLRVVVSSSNLTRHDCETLLQNVWHQDFPRIASPSPSLGPPLSSPYPFLRGQFGIGREIENFLDKLGVLLLPYPFPQQQLDTDAHPEPSLSFPISSLLCNFDFTNCSVSLVASVPSIIESGDAKDRDEPHFTYGLTRLKELVTKVMRGLKSEIHASESFYITSAIGYITLPFLSQFLEAIGSNVAKSKIKQGKNNGPLLGIVFPSIQSIEAMAYRDCPSSLGCVTVRYHDRSNVCASQRMLYDYTSYPIPIHCKILFGLLNLSTLWVYAGSHNFTESSWGLQRATKLALNNYEVGIFFQKEIEKESISGSSSQRKQAQLSLLDLDLNQLLLPIITTPQKLPLIMPYRFSSSPWIHSEQKQLLIEAFRKLREKRLYNEELNYHWIQFMLENDIAT